MTPLGNGLVQKAGGVAAPLDVGSRPEDVLEDTERIRFSTSCGCTFCHKSGVDETVSVLVPNLAWGRAAGVRSRWLSPRWFSSAVFPLTLRSSFPVAHAPPGPSHPPLNTRNMCPRWHPSNLLPHFHVETVNHRPVPLQHATGRGGASFHELTPTEQRAYLHGIGPLYRPNQAHPSCSETSQQLALEQDDSHLCQQKQNKLEPVFLKQL